MAESIKVTVIGHGSKRKFLMLRSPTASDSHFIVATRPSSVPRDLQ